MGLLKLVGKAVGSVVLGAAGTVSAIGKGVCDIVGADGAAEFFDTVKDGSFGVVEGMWEDVDVGKELGEAVENIGGIIATGMASTSKSMVRELDSMARTARENGDDELYDRITEKREKYSEFGEFFAEKKDEYQETLTQRRLEKEEELMLESDEYETGDDSTSYDD